MLTPFEVFSFNYLNGCLSDVSNGLNNCRELTLKNYFHNNNNNNNNNNMFQYFTLYELN